MRVVRRRHHAGGTCPITKWCSATCRHRAWEQTRDAVSGRSAVEVLERRIEVPVALVPTRRDRPRVLREPAAQLGDGRLYDRDLAPLATAMATSLAALRHGMSLLPWQESTDFVSEELCPWTAHSGTVSPLAARRPSRLLDGRMLRRCPNVG